MCCIWYKARTHRCVYVSGGRFFTTQSLMSDFLAYLRSEFTDEEQQRFVDNFHAFLTHNAETDFVVDLDEVYHWLGFGRKGHAKDAVKRILILDTTYIVRMEGLLPQSRKQTLDSRGGHNKQTILMTINGFKHLCMAVRTEEGDRTRRYYIKMENAVNHYAMHRVELQMREHARQMQEMELEHARRVKDQEEQHARDIKLRTEQTLHQTLVSVYQRQPVMYFARVNTPADDGSAFLLKLGWTKNVAQRAQDHRYDFGPTFVLLDVVPCTFAMYLEEYAKKLPDLMARQYLEPVGRKHERQTEVYAMDDVSTYKQILATIVKRRDEMLSEDQTQLHMKELEIEGKRLDVRLRELDIQASQAAVASSEGASSSSGGRSPAPVLDPDALMALKPPERRYTQGRGSKVQCYSKDGKTLIKTYPGYTEATRDSIFNGMCTLGRVKLATQQHTVYKGFRWANLERELPDDTVQELPETVESRTVHTGVVVLLNVARTRIERAFCDMKDAAETYDVGISTISSAIKRGNRSCGGYFLPWDDCPEELRAAYLAEHALPEKRTRATGQAVLQLQPGTNKVVKRFANVQDVIKSMRVSRVALLRAIEAGEPIRGFCWEFQASG